MADFVKVNQPTPISGDSVSSVACVGGGSCGTSSSNNDCSGGYGCPDGEGEGGLSVPGGDYLLAPGTELPDDTTKIPQRCFKPTINKGVENSDPFIPVIKEDIIKNTTDFWKVQIDVFPLKAQPIIPNSFK